MTDNGIPKKAAIGTAVGFAGVALFQLMLAAGAPWGEAAWGGANQGRLPTGLRVGSAISIVVYSLAASVVLARAGFRVRFISGSVARFGTWVIVVLLALGAVANFASSSPWERFLLGPVTLLLAALCLLVARSPRGAVGSTRTPRPARGPLNAPPKVLMRAQIAAPALR